MSMFDRKNETLPREELAQVQLERAQALVARLRRNVPRYRGVLGDVRLETLDDLRRIPPTMPADLAAAFPYGLFALPLREVIRLHSALGAGGAQLVVGHTRNDLAQWGRLAARQIVAAGSTSNDVIQIGFSGGLFNQALAYIRGAELMEASVIPQDTAHPHRQLAVMQNFRASVLITTPTQARDLIRALREKSVDPQSLHLRVVLLSRPVSPEEREELATELFTEVRCSFGLAEVLDPGLCVECEEHRLHVNEDHFLVELDNGELLVTTLTREAMPLLRYRTSVQGRLESDRCSCGRTGVVLVPGARLDERFRVNEMPLYRWQIEDVLAQTKAAGHSFALDFAERGVSVAIRVSDQLFPDTIRELEGLKQEIAAECFTRLGIRAQVTFHSPITFGPMDKREPEKVGWSG
jgi:phenylacetate-CoA ligase